MRMRHKGNRLVLAAGGALILLATSGCSRIREHQGFLIEPLVADSVVPGIDNKESVQGSMGHPTFKSQFGPERWYYVSRNTKQLAFSTPAPTAQAVYIVEFDNAGNVSDVKKQVGLEQVSNIHPVGDKTPTLGRQRSLFDEIFGNIGAVGAGGLGGGGAGAPGGPGPNG